MTSYFKSLDNNAVDPESTDILVLNAGFEERSSRAAENLDKNFANHILICQIDDTGEKSVLKIKETALAKSANLHELSLSTKSPIDIADNFIGAMVGIVGGELKSYGGNSNLLTSGLRSRASSSNTANSFVLCTSALKDELSP